MTKKLLLASFIILIIPSIFYGEETQGLAVDYVTRIQDEISADISKLRASLETELEGIKLDSSDIARRTQELEVLSERASDDMAAWE